MVITDTLPLAPLRRELDGLNSARRGAYRIIYEIDDRAAIVTVLSSSIAPPPTSRTENLRFKSPSPTVRPLVRGCTRMWAGHVVRAREVLESVTLSA